MDKQVKFWNGVMKKQNVIKVHNCVFIVDEVFKDFVHKELKGCWCIAEFKGHNHQFKKAKRAFEGGFPFIIFFNMNVVVAPADIKL